MDIAKVLLQLREDLANLDSAIASLERLEQLCRRHGHSPASASLLHPDEKNTADIDRTAAARRRRGRPPKAARPGSGPVARNLDPE